MLAREHAKRWFPPATSSATPFRAQRQSKFCSVVVDKHARYVLSSVFPQLLFGRRPAPVRLFEDQSVYLEFRSLFKFVLCVSQLFFFPGPPFDLRLLLSSSPLNKGRCYGFGEASTLSDFLLMTLQLVLPSSRSDPSSKTCRLARR